MWAAPVCGMAKEKICKRGTYRPKETARAAAAPQQHSQVIFTSTLPNYHITYFTFFYMERQIISLTGHYLATWMHNNIRRIGLLFYGDDNFYFGGGRGGEEIVFCETVLET